MADLEQLRKLQYRLYERAYQEAHSFYVQKTEAFRRYEKKFENSLPGQYDVQEIERIFRDLRNSDIILFGDFHTFRQSQRELIRLLRTYLRRSEEKFCVCMEAFRKIDQAHLDSYMMGELGDVEFLKLIDYKKTWGFPWANYKMLLDFFRQHDMKVFGLNTDTVGADSLIQRDKFAANELISVSKLYPNHKVICLIGEFHLASMHLPKWILNISSKKGLKYNVLRILTNIDRYYFSLSSEGGHFGSEILKLKDRYYCIINSPPWLKWQSYSLFEEMRSLDVLSEDADGLGSELDDEEHDYTEPSIDLDYKFFDTVRMLADFLKIGVNKADLANFHLHSAVEDESLTSLVLGDDLQTQETVKIIERASLGGVFFLPESRSIILASISVNNIAEAAGQFLHHILTGFREDGISESEVFYRNVLKYVVGMIASNIFNPRRKALEPQHYVIYVEHHRKRRLIGAQRNKRDIAKAIVKHHEWMIGRVISKKSIRTSPLNSVYKLDPLVNFDVSRRIGLYLGHDFYKAMLSKQFNSIVVRDIFTSSFDSYRDLTDFVYQLFNVLYVDPTQGFEKSASSSNQVNSSSAG